MMWANRTEAGAALARVLRPLAATHPLVVALPRGGVPVAAKVASSLRARLDVWIVRKIGMPGHEEFGVGAVAESGREDAQGAGDVVVVLDDASLRAAGLQRDDVAHTILHESAEVRARMQRFRDGRIAPRVAGRVVIVVDDGVATGATARAALQAIRAQRPARVILAVPVAARDSVVALRAWCDDVVVLHQPMSMDAVGSFYRDFAQVPDAEVTRTLRDDSGTLDDVAETDTDTDATRIRRTIAASSDDVGGARGDRLS